MTPLIQGTAKCRLCQKTFQGPRAIIIGADQSAASRVQKFITSLAEHVQREHTPQLAHAAAMQQEFFGMLILSNYEINDPALADQFNFFRWRTHQSTLKGGFTVAGIEKAAAQYAEQSLSKIDKDQQLSVTLRADIRAAVEANVREAMLFMREQLQEPDAYVITDPTDPKAVG